MRSDPRGGEAVRLELEDRVRSDLSALREAEEEYRSATGRYTYEADALGMAPSAGVEIDILEATADGFSAVGRAGTVECALFVGGAEPPRGYTREAGRIACRG